MKIFISHAIIDQALIKSIKQTLEPHSLTLFIAEHYVDLKQSITEKIEKMIRQSDVALILLTENGFNSKFVQQEIGYIKSLRKPYLQLVQTGIENKITGFNYGRDYISLDLNQPNIALEKVKNALLNYWKKQQKRRRQKILAKQKELEKQKRLRELEELRIKQQQQESQAIISLGILAGLLILVLILSSGDKIQSDSNRLYLRP